MIEIKRTNGDCIRFMDNQNLAKWIVDIAEDISLGRIDGTTLENWLNDTPEAVIPSAIWADMLRNRFMKRE